VDADGRGESVEDLTKSTEPGVVAPIAGVCGLDIEELFAEPFGDMFRDAGLADAAGSGEDGWVGGFPVRDYA
jgi:hypothetical protein